MKSKTTKRKGKKRKKNIEYIDFRIPINGSEDTIKYLMRKLSCECKSK